MVFGILIAIESLLYSHGPCGQFISEEFDAML
jgi:hypothetical protein